MNRHREIDGGGRAIVCYRRPKLGPQVHQYRGTRQSPSPDLPVEAQLAQRYDDEQHQIFAEQCDGG